MLQIDISKSSASDLSGRKNIFGKVFKNNDLSMTFSKKIKKNSNNLQKNDKTVKNLYFVVTEGTKKEGFFTVLNF